MKYWRALFVVMLAFCLAFCLQILSLLCCCIFCSVPGSFIVHVLAQQTLHWILIAILNTRGSPPNFHRFWQMALRVLYSAPGGGGGWHFRSAISHRSCFRHRRIIFRGTSAAVGEVAGAAARLSHFVFPTGKIPNTSMTPRKARILNAPRNLNPQEGLRECKQREPQKSRHVDDAAKTRAFVQLLERGVDVSKLHAVCHEVFQGNLARHPLVDQLGHTARDTRAQCMVSAMYREEVEDEEAR
jgi:hypothetical protein